MSSAATIVSQRVVYEMTAAGIRSPDRVNQRNGYRERAWDTRAGRIDLAIPKLRKVGHDLK